MKKVIILANKYPSENDPNVNVFTQQVAWSLLDAGVSIIVICPNPVNYNKDNVLLPYYSLEQNESDKKLEIYRPKYVGLGQDSEFMQKVRVNFTTKMYVNAVDRILKRLKIDNNYVLLAEFLCPSGVAAAILGNKYGIDSYMQIGEATYQGDRKYGNSWLKEKLKPLTGAIALSGYIKNYIVNSGILEKDKISIIPSGYRKECMYRRDKSKARDRLGLPQDKFIVGFCGSFDDRKGILRLQKAIDNINDENVVLAACGKGECNPTSDKLVWNGPINHEELSWFYSSLDVFAFPTYFEGCCTAIVEAIACGCPIISSNRSFNDEICNSKNSILLDPDDIQAMQNSILSIKRDKGKQFEMSKSSLEKAKDLSLNIKAIKMINFMNLDK